MNLALLNVSVTYSFDIEIENFLGETDAGSATVLIQDDSFPLVSIVGSKTQYTDPSRQLELFAQDQAGCALASAPSRTVNGGRRMTRASRPPPAGRRP